MACVAYGSGSVGPVVTDMTPSRRLWIRVFYGVLFCLGFFVSVRFIYRALFSVPDTGPRINVTIPQGASLSETADRLHKARLIPSSGEYWIFGLFSLSARHPLGSTYGLRPGTSYRRMAQLLNRGPSRIESETRIIEGWTLEEEMEYLDSQKQVRPSEFAQIAGRSQNRVAFDPALREAFPFLQSLPDDRSLEGYLFPETYRVWEDLLPDGLIRKQLGEFQKRFVGVTVTTASAPLKTLDEVVTLASIVEKEVSGEKDRKIVAGIFLRRLREGMPLQSDATLNYLTRAGRTRPTADDLAIESAFNSYKNKGLPPSPICNPGESAIRAVLQPTASKYRYFLTDLQGDVLYASTFEGHKRNRLRAGY